MGSGAGPEPGGVTEAERTQSNLSAVKSDDSRKGESSDGTEVETHRGGCLTSLPRGPVGAAGLQVLTLLFTGQEPR